MKTDKTLSIMKVISWITLIGLCIKTGALIFSFIVSIFFNAEKAKTLPMDIDLSLLYSFNAGHYAVIVLLMIFFLTMKTFIFYLVTKIFSKINLSHPFNLNVANLIIKISYALLGIGLIAMLATVYKNWLVKNGAFVLLKWEYGVYLFMAGIVFIVAQLFKRGIEIQSENELTV